MAAPDRWVPSEGARADGSEPPEPLEADLLEATFRAEYVALVQLATYLSDRAVAEEIVQDAFVRVFGRLRRVDPGRVVPYLRRAVVNGTRSHLRRKRVRQRAVPGVPRAEPAAELGAVTRLEREEILATLTSLPRRQQQVLALRYYVDLTEAEIARTLGISTGAVKTHAHRGLAAMGDRLAGEASDGDAAEPQEEGR